MLGYQFGKVRGKIFHWQSSARKKFNDDKTKSLSALADCPGGSAAPAVPLPAEMLVPLLLRCPASWTPVAGPFGCSGFPGFAPPAVLVGWSSCRVMGFHFKGLCAYQAALKKKQLIGVINIYRITAWQ